MTDRTLTTVYGCSDDLIELDGAIREEFAAYDCVSRLTFDNGAVLTVTYGGEGIWRVETNGHPSASVLRCEDREGFTDPDGPIYSDLASVYGATKVEQETTGGDS